MNRLSEFIEEVWKEKEDRKLWEVWLYKVQDGTSYEDFLKKVTRGGRNSNPRQKPVSDQEVKSIIKDSQSVLKMFSA